MSPHEALAERYAALARSIEPHVAGLRILPVDASPGAESSHPLTFPLQAGSGIRLGLLVIELDVAPADEPALRARLAPAVECLRQELAATDAAARAIELRLLRLANELDIDFGDDPQFDKAVSAVALRTGAEVAWLSAPCCGLRVTASPRGEPTDPELLAEVAALPARVAALAGQLRRPLAINGPGARPERAARCRLLVVPLFIGRARHPCWLVLANARTAPPVGGWQMLPAMTLGQALARRLEIDLDRRTGLFNRGGLEAAMRRLGRGEASLVLLDVDRLHAINQMHGLAAGDAAIGALALLLAPPVLPPQALVARLNGGTFAIVLPGADPATAVECATAVQGAAAEIVPGRDGAPLTLSGGVARIASLREPLDAALVAAEFLLKLAKERGRSRIERDGDGNTSVIRRHDEVFAAADLREALRTGKLVLYAQRIASLKDAAAPPGFELLVRIKDALGEMLSPADFIAAAQRYQLLTALDRHVVEQAFTTLAPHRALLARMSVSMSVNVSGQSIGDEAFVDWFIEQMRNARFPAGLITVEITEQQAVTNLAQAAKSMRRLREAGCAIALDDFGTGANSLTYLRSLPVTRIKIDGSFVRDMAANPLSEATVRGIVQLARDFRADTVAEYVETEAVAGKLRAMGVDRAQGHLFGEPQPLETVLRELADSEFAELRDLLRS